MKFWRIKWENIFALIMILEFVNLSIQYFMYEEFDLSIYGTIIILMSISTFIIWICTKESRKLYLSE